jgi:hypothetical protein
MLAALSLGLVIGGALSNVIDRLIHGAVADFFLFHAGSFEWYVFNLADVWICGGAVGLALAWRPSARNRHGGVRGGKMAGIGDGIRDSPVTRSRAEGVIVLQISGFEGFFWT